MNNLKKVGLTALGTTLVASASVAGEMSVTGSAVYLTQVLAPTLMLILGHKVTASNSMVVET